MNSPPTLVLVVFIFLPDSGTFSLREGTVGASQIKRNVYISALLRGPKSKRDTSVCTVQFFRKLDVKGEPREEVRLDNQGLYANEASYSSIIMNLHQLYGKVPFTYDEINQKIAKFSTENGSKRKHYSGFLSDLEFTTAQFIQVGAPPEAAGRSRFFLRPVIPTANSSFANSSYSQLFLQRCPILPSRTVYVL
jgi:hypothetical protein